MRWNTGVGIPEEHRERVFERFHRVEGTQARTFEGTGIGLPFVQELVRLHGGDVRVESALGHGSMFTVTIPLGTAHLPPERIQVTRPVSSTGVTADVYAQEAQGWLADEWNPVDVAALPKSASLTPLTRPESVIDRELIVVADDNADMRANISGTCWTADMRCMPSRTAFRRWRPHDFCGQPCYWPMS